MDASVPTAQICFPDEPANRRGRIYRPETVLSVRDTTVGEVATISFVLPQ